MSETSNDPHARGGPANHVQSGARTPSHAERVRTLLAGQDAGTLSTIALDPAGFPFGSIVTFAVDGRGAPLALMSTMAEHARNLDADDRCSLLVSEAGSGAGRLAAARATLVGRMRRVDDAQQDEATATYLDAHPGAYWARFPDFSVHRLEVQTIRYVRGFGEMSWVDGADHAAAEADPVAPAEAGIVSHMNEDHAHNLRDMVDAYLDVPEPVTDVTMLSCDRYGFEVRIGIEADTPDGNTVAFGRIGFDEPLERPEQAREAMVALVRALDA